LTLLADKSPERLLQLLKVATPEQRRTLAPLIEAELERRRTDWHLLARPDQLPPVGDWLIWLILAGRGWGKTRTGAEFTKTRVRTPEMQWAVVAPTFADARDTCVEGPSGLLSVLPPAEVKTWNRSLGELLLVNKSRIKLFSADEPDRIRGFNGHGSWCDELAAWRYPDAWDQLQFALRLGTHPQSVVTTTPRPTKLVRDLVARPTGVHITKGSTFDNAANLAPAALAEMKARYEGTRLGRQELEAELLTDVPGALTTLAELDAGRVSSFPDVVRSLVISTLP